MTRVGWSFVAIAAQMLRREEREVATGDLAEAGESAWQALADILGLVLYRQAAPWKSWRPWLAGFGLAGPNSLALMGASVSVSRILLQLRGRTVPNGGLAAVLPDLICDVFLLIAWSWSGGFVAASVSRRTLWASAVLCALPCLFCLARFRIASLSAFSLFLFVPAAILGVRRGLRSARISRRCAILLAVTITILMLPMLSGGSWRAFRWALLWPAWWLLAAGRESGTKAEPA